MVNIVKGLNLGCGPNWKSYPEYEGLDIIDYGQEFVGDVLKILPTLAGRDYLEVMAYHFLEHFNQDDLRLVLKDIHDALRDGGRFKVIVPHMRKERAWILTHKTFWNEATFQWLVEEEASSVYGLGKWKILELVTNSRDDIYACLVKI